MRGMGINGSFSAKPTDPQMYTPQKSFTVNGSACQGTHLRPRAMSLGEIEAWASRYDEEIYDLVSTGEVDTAEKLVNEFVRKLVDFYQEEGAKGSRKEIKFMEGIITILSRFLARGFVNTCGSAIRRDENYSGSISVTVILPNRTDLAKYFRNQ